MSYNDGPRNYRFTYEWHKGPKGWHYTSGTPEDKKLYLHRWAEYAEPVTIIEHYTTKENGAEALVTFGTQLQVRYADGGTEGFLPGSQWRTLQKNSETLTRLLDDEKYPYIIYNLLTAPSGL